jgi:hypothetical protein
MGSSHPDLIAPLLTVADVMARYRLHDRRTARRLMDAAGGFRMGANLFVRLEDLLAHEERQMAARRAQVSREPAPAPAAASPRSPRPLEPGWWRPEPDYRA